jgi:hypothetical protein
MLPWLELRITEHTEIGDNTSIKNPKPIDIGPKGSRRQRCVSGGFHETQTVN